MKNPNIDIIKEHVKRCEELMTIINAWLYAVSFLPENHPMK